MAGVVETGPSPAMACPKGASVEVPFLWYLSLSKQRNVLARTHWRMFERLSLKAGEKPLQRFLKAALRQDCTLFRPPHVTHFEPPELQAGAHCRATNIYFVNTL